MQVQHALYSPDLAPCTFFVFPKLKIYLKVKWFKDVNNIKKTTNGKLTGISVLNAKVTILRKLLFHSLFISILVDTASVSIIFEHT